MHLLSLPDDKLLMLKMMFVVLACHQDGPCTHILHSRFTWYAYRHVHE
jgi:hypothetical protein